MRPPPPHCSTQSPTRSRFHSRRRSRSARAARRRCRDWPADDRTGPTRARAASRRLGGDDLKSRRRHVARVQAKQLGKMSNACECSIANLQSMWSDETEMKLTRNSRRGVSRVDSTRTAVPRGLPTHFVGAGRHQCQAGERGGGQLCAHTT